MAALLETQDMLAQAQREINSLRAELAAANERVLYWQKQYAAAEDRRMVATEDLCKSADMWLATVATLTEDRDRMRRALEPFAKFEKSLRSYHEGKFDPPFSELQREWPRHKPVLRRTFPVGDRTASVADLWREDFERAATAVDAKDGEP